MTVTYTQKVSDCRGFGSFWRLLFRWRGSLYKLVWPDTLVYIFLYSICSMVYRFGLNEEQRRTFEHVALYCDYFRNLIPISFVLGFYVSVVVQRWWEQYLTIPWPDDLALFCTAYIRGKNGQPRLIRSTLLRYVNLTFALTFSRISPKVKKKFPNYKEMMEAGYLNAHEIRILESQETKFSVPLAVVPIKWCCLLVERARFAGYIDDNFGMKVLLSEIKIIREKSGMLLRWNEISIPLVYTQVATMAVYSFFFFSVLGRQFLDPGQQYANRTIDFFVPIFTLLQFFFYMGWLKVAESLVNPFGEDDDDFELDKILERHFEMSYLLGNVTLTENPANLEELCCEGPHNSYIHNPNNNNKEKDVSRPGQGDGTRVQASQQPSSDLSIRRPSVYPDSKNPFDFLWEEMDLSGPSEDCSNSSNTRAATSSPSVQSERSKNGASEAPGTTPDNQVRHINHSCHSNQDQVNLGNHSLDNRSNNRSNSKYGDGSNFANTTYSQVVGPRAASADGYTNPTYVN